MPTTRSRKRPSEVFSVLPDPTRKIRKISTFSTPRNSAASPGSSEDDDLSIFDNFPVIPLDSTADTSSLASRASKPFYTDSCTQTKSNVYLLTREDLEAVVEETVERAMASSKRMRDEDDEQSTPSAKRINLTPSANTGYDFLFNKPPNTAPAKTLFGNSSTPGRVIRGPVSARKPTPGHRHRRTPLHNSIGGKQNTKYRPTQVKPPDLAPIRSSSMAAGDEQSNEIKEENESPSATASAQPARRGLFGSLRGLAQSGIEFALNLSPRKVSSSSQTEPADNNAQSSSPVETDDQNNNDEVDDREGETEQDGSREYNSSTSPDEELQSMADRPLPSTEPRSSRYEHLHHIRAGSNEERRLAAGEWVAPPRAPTPPSEFEAAKLRNPGVPDATLRNLLARRARRKAFIGETSVPNSAPPKVAPLFGPDSHYARGTVDPRFVSPKAYRMFAKYPTLTGSSAGSKRPFDAFDADQQQENDYQAPTVEDEEDEAHMHDEFDEDALPDTPLAKKQKILPNTPRSALKKQNDFGGSIGRSVRSVNFKANPVSGSRDLRAHYGPAGQYKGSTFADLSSPTSNDESSLSTMGYEDVISPSTKLNTFTNLGSSKIDVMLALEKNIGAKIPNIDFTLRDPNNPDWRPSLTNPRPGSFRVPYTDEESLSDEEIEDPPVNTVPPQPSTPRISHAELPAPATATSQVSNNNSFNESSIQFESTELAIEKARSKAQKYKPKDSSRLSEVSVSRRSPSPEAGDTPRATLSDLPAVQSVENPVSSSKQRTPYVATPLDNTTRGEDGMTDHEREHQYDDWAAALPWGSAQSYENAGTGTKEIHDLIRKNWTNEDSRRSEEFWQKEFDDIEQLQEKAKARGQVLQFITGMEDADQIMEITA